VLAVMVVPHRPAMRAAKMLSTIDVLSGGRLVVSIGAGWLQAEFDAVVMTPFAERGRVTDEYLRVFRSVWTEEAPRFEGSWVEVDGIFFNPNRCRSHIRRSGSATKAFRHCAAPQGWATLGIQS
jgi:alkanesulfonate monooxygenase SsuD/methylene tetrahydromethanopterin reductase-like flavin-dependent oxidoreductase (luciferase family)